MAWSALTNRSDQMRAPRGQRPSNLPRPEADRTSPLRSWTGQESRHGHAWQPSMKRDAEVSSAARLELEIGGHPIQVRNDPAQAVALAANRADLLPLFPQPLGAPAHG